jgi:phosphatidylserine decarboxylase
MMIMLLLFVLLAAVLAAFLFYRLWFLRKPVRTVPPDNSIVSPASGRVVRILSISKAKERLPKGLLGSVDLLVKDVAKKGRIIVIMMTPLDVHYQRSPVEGVVVKTAHKKGLFLNAVLGASSLSALRNEKNEILIKNSKIGKVKVVQVAGFLARRIRCFVKKQQKVLKGEEIGLICLGSQVILVLPEIDLKVREGQRVVDGETVIARF